MNFDFREDYFRYGGTIKAYFCNKPKYDLGSSSNFVHEEVKRLNRTNSSANKSEPPIPPPKPKLARQRSDLKNFPNDERFYVPKDKCRKSLKLKSTVNDK